MLFPPRGGAASPVPHMAPNRPGFSEKGVLNASQKCKQPATLSGQLSCSRECHRASGSDRAPGRRRSLSVHGASHPHAEPARARWLRLSWAKPTTRGFFLRAELILEKLEAAQQYKASGRSDAGRRVRGSRSCADYPRLFERAASLSEPYPATRSCPRTAGPG